MIFLKGSFPGLFEEKQASRIACAKFWHKRKKNVQIYSIKTEI